MAPWQSALHCLSQAGQSLACRVDTCACLPHTSRLGVYALRAHVQLSASGAQAAQLALDLFAAGQAQALQRGLLLVDTKYELGLDAQGQLMLVDEIHTPDSSRHIPRPGSPGRALMGAWHMAPASSGHRAAELPCECRARARGSSLTSDSEVSSDC